MAAWLPARAESRPPGLGRTWRAPLCLQGAVVRMLLVHTLQQDLYLQLGKASFPWLQSLAPFLPCLQTERISQQSSPDVHPAWPQGWTQEHLRKKV